MKKISIKRVACIIWLAFLAYTSFFFLAFAEDSDACKFSTTGDTNIISSIRNCAPEQGVQLDGGSGLDASKDRLIEIINQLIAVGSVISMGGISYAAMMFATAGGDDGKVSKAKEAAKYGTGGFVVMMMASPLVNALVNLLFGLD